MPDRQASRILAGAAGLLCAGAAHANAGTAMVVFGLGHLLVGNLLIGGLEWWMLALLLRRRGRLHPGGALLVVLGNYLSAGVGFALLTMVWPAVVTELAPAPLQQARDVILVSWFVLFVITVLLERWFIGRAMTPREGRQPSGWPALKATLVVNLLSYALLSAFYFQACPVTLATQVRWDPGLSFARGAAATVYYLGEGGSVCRVRLDGSGREQVLPADPNRRGAGFWLGLDPVTGRLGIRDDDGLPAARPLLPGVGRAPVFPGGGRERPTYEYPWRHWWAMDLRPSDVPRGEVSLGFWAYEGITVKPVGREPRLRLALETPFVSYTARHGTVLGNDLLVCELVRAANETAKHTGQVVVLDLRRRLIGVLAQGGAPLVVLDEPPAGAQWYDPKSPPVKTER